MKTEIVSGHECSTKKIDWGKVQIVKSIHTGLIVLTNGESKNDDFHGTAISVDVYGNIEFSRSWAKDSFQPITEPLTIKFIP